jgi:autotransporter-associated beta strand protein
VLKAGLAPLLVVLLAPAGHAAIFTVTNAADSGAGSLRQAITDSNLAGGSNRIVWGAGGGGTLTLLSGLPAIGGGTVLDATNAPSAVTVAGSPNPLPLGVGGAVTFNNDSVPQVWTVSTVVSGAGSLTKTGAGTLALSGVNTFTGGTALIGGAVNVNADAALGDAASTVTLNGGILQAAGALTVAHSLSFVGSSFYDTQAFNTTLSGQISGAGSMTVLGTGKVTITGTNVYTGGTVFNAGTLNINNAAALGTGAVTFNGGTLQTATALTLANTLVLNSSSGTFDTLGNNSTLSGSIVGGGGLNVLGAGVLTLTGSSSYSGGTVFGAGTLNINNNSALGSGGVTFNGGLLQTASTVTIGNVLTLGAAGGTIDTQGNNSVFSGVIQGAGALTTISTETLSLTGANTYAGGTNLNAGILNVNADAALGAGVLTFNGGTLQAGGSLITSKAMTLNAGGGTIDTNGYSAALSGVIGGAGALTKTGLGTLTLNAANTYGGATTVNAGVLALDVDNALPNHALNVVSGAGLALADHVQSVASFVGAGATSLTLKTAGSNLTVAGNANLTGGTLIIAPPANHLVAVGEVYTPIAYGSVTGQYAIVSPAALSFTPTYNAGNLTLTAGFVPFKTVAATGNQGAAGAGYEPLRAAPGTDASAVLINLYGMTAPQLQSALDQLSPVSLASMQGVGMAGSSVQSAAVRQRTTALADGTARPGYATYQVSGRSMFPGTLVAAAGAGDEPGFFAPKAAEELGSNSPWGFFTSGVVTTGKLADANSAAGTQPGYTFNSGGLTAGADYRLNDAVAVGGSAGYLRGHASVDTAAGGTVDDDSARYGTYASARAGDLRANLYVGGALDFFKTARNISFGTVARTAKGAPMANEFNMSSGLSYDVRTTQWGIFSPFAGLDYDRMMINGFTETGAGTLDLAVAPQTAESMRSNVGLKYSQKLTSDARVYVPYVSLGWRHEFDNQSRPITAQFAGASPFTVATGDTARDGTILGAGLTVGLGKWTTGKLEYTGDFASHYRATRVDASLRFAF